MSEAAWVRPDPLQIHSAFNRIFRSNVPLAKLKDKSVDGQLSFHLHYDTPHHSPPDSDDEQGVIGRSMAWKLFLTPSAPLTQGAPPQPPLAALRASRAVFVQLLKEKLRAPDGTYEKGVIIPNFNTRAKDALTPSSDNWTRNNPLSLDEGSGWNDWYAGVELRKTIRQDVERTFPEMPYFRDPIVQSHLTTILFLHCSSNPAIGYRQGMHELLAPLLYAIDYDSLPPAPSTSSTSSSSSTPSTPFASTSLDHLSPSAPDPELAELCDRTWIAADAWALFGELMHEVGPWYEWREPPPPAASEVEGEMTPYVAPIVSVCNKLQSTDLKAVDPLLWSKMREVGVEPQIYGIRWLRLLFTREFCMSESMLLWDALFALNSICEVAQWICIAMLLRIRNQLIPLDYSGQLTVLLRYPAIPASDVQSSTSHITLLVQQAVTLRASPTPSTGASIVFQNRNILGIPTEVPDPPPPRRRVMKPGDRARSVAGRSSMDQRKDAMGLSDMISKGLLDINGAVLNTVSEIRRNLPEITPTLAKGSESEVIAFPYQSQSSGGQASEERPPWEPRTRFDMEREAASLRAMQKKLGEAVGWAVDTLLQGEGDMEPKKREALACLAYVREVLGRGSVVELEEDRLVGEEELARRKAKAEEERNRKAEAAAVAAVEPTAESFSEPSRPPLAYAYTDVSPSSPTHSTRPRVQVPVREVHPTGSLPRTLYSPQTAFSSSSAQNTPQAARIHGHAASRSLSSSAPSQRPIAPPWQHTPSNFLAASGGTLPRLPPPLSPPTSFHSGMGDAGMTPTNGSGGRIPLTRVGAVDAGAYRQQTQTPAQTQTQAGSPRGFDTDPLGALR
ncbi:hypothetical protein BOTBODRAFT_621649 [Botryobasidium botryosum FD-172 SS1]|uniref:Rab-GAP TBC domain-containing protein n=1 Tax=Botryobasidium botryosum (strain FD-172 SS1) TaxID=930990 RepID=A0A067LUF5_BOTB1|nr:hypothetical protein BOTBODRAFT_621649 [Botryobasidium botryosum FD-172 SS1]